MPRASYLNTQATRKADAIRQVNTEGEKFLRGACDNANKLNERWNKSLGTCYNRLRNPENLTLKELVEISMIYGLHCNIELQNGSTTTKISW